MPAAGSATTVARSIVVILYSLIVHRYLPLRRQPTTLIMSAPVVVAVVSDCKFRINEQSATGARLSSPLLAFAGCSRQMTDWLTLLAADSHTTRGRDANCSH